MTTEDAATLRFLTHSWKYQNGPITVCLKCGCYTSFDTQDRPIWYTVGGVTHWVDQFTCDEIITHQVISS